MRKLLLVVLALCVSAHAVHAKPRKKHHKPHKPTWFEYRAFPPTSESLIQQNQAIDALHLIRIIDKKQLTSMVDEDLLVPVEQNHYVRISPKLEADRRFCKPWVNAFLQELGQAYYEEFGDAIQVNSAVRTIKTQMRLLRWNHNAAPFHGEKASAHLAGVAVDLQRRGLTQAQVRFIQQKLLALAAMHMVIVEEELKQPCFHVVVTGDYPYLPASVSKKQPVLVDFKEVTHDFDSAADCPKRTP